MSDLLPCPHCGGEAYIRRTIVNDDTMRVSDYDAMYTVFCEDSEDCGASVAYFTERKQAISAWNRRAEYGDYMIGTDDDDHSDPGEYGRNPVTAEDVLRAAAQMRAEVEVKEKNLMTDSQREAMVLEMKAASLKSYVERQAATDKAERDLLATVAGDGYSYMVLWAFEGGEPYLVRMGKKKPLDTEEGS